MAIENAGALLEGFMDCDKVMEGGAIEGPLVETDSLDMPQPGDAQESIPSE